MRIKKTKQEDIKLLFLEIIHILGSNIHINTVFQFTVESINSFFSGASHCYFYRINNKIVKIVFDYNWR